MEVARPERFELPTSWFVAMHSIQLSYGRVFDYFFGGEGGIRTLEGLLTLTPLAGERFQPLSHLSDPGTRPGRATHHTDALVAEQGRLLPLAGGSFGCFLGFFFALDALVDFFAVNCDFSRRVDSDAHLVSLHSEDGDCHLVPDHDRFADPPGQYQHLAIPPGRTAAIQGVARFLSSTFVHWSPGRGFPAWTDSNPRRVNLPPLAAAAIRVLRPVGTPRAVCVRRLRVGVRPPAPKS